MSLFRIFCLVWLCFVAVAERLPVRNYTSSDGLLQDGAILQILQDSHGFLWFVNGIGLSRFDGQTFHNYGASDGLPEISQIIQTANGEYWIASDEGLVQYRPSARGKKFEITRVGDTRSRNHLTSLAEDPHGGLWIGTWDGLFHATPKAGSGFDIRFVLRPETPPHTEPGALAPIQFVYVDKRGVLWATADYCGVYRLLPDGTIQHYTSRDGLPTNTNTGGPFLEDRLGRMWLATAGGLLELDPEPQSALPFVRRKIDTRFGLKESPIHRIAEAPDGHLWMASANGLLEFDGSTLRQYTRRNGLSEDRFWSVCFDRSGNLWVGADSTGVTRIARSGFTSFDLSDGIGQEMVRSVMELSSGELIAVTGYPDAFRIHLWEGRRFRVIRPKFPPGTGFGWGVGQIVLHDHLGETWIATYNGVARFGRTSSIRELDGRSPKTIYTMCNGLPSNNIFSLFEDAAGDIWIGNMFPPRFGLARWIRRENRIENLSHAPGVTADRTAIAFIQSASGTIWIAFPTGLSRFRGGQFVSFKPSDGLPKDTIGSLFIDAQGTVWGTGHNGGLFRVVDPESEHPQFKMIGQEDGLSSSEGICATGDSAGKIYAGTFRGISRLDPSNGEIDYFNTSDGLANSLLYSCTHDASGQLWFGTLQGLSRFSPGSAVQRAFSPTRITSVQVADRSVPISDLGEATVNVPAVDAGQNRLQISFVAPNPGNAIRYHYKLARTDKGWSEPATVTNVNYANLAPGKYQFLVEAINSQDRHPASVTFTILPPIWSRWWFIALSLAVVSGGAYTAYRFRLEHLLKVERVRTRIATDLHDDIGSALSQIALLSEVARRNAAVDPEMESLGRIAVIAREATASMSDIVWTINPRRDSLGDLCVRIRQFANEVCSARNIDCVVMIPESDQGLKLTMETRRQLLLTAKEAIHNVIRHAKCSSAKIELKREVGAVILRVRDNGVGFDPNTRSEGHGIASMRSRAQVLCGTLHIDSGLSGTCIELRIPG